MENPTEIPKAYEPAAVEAKWQARWTEAGCFTANPKRVSASRPAFSIVIPPPNITGVLTLGHVLNNTIQDILARRARQTGHEVLWLPGTDHAGLATQNVVEKTLRKEEKLTRHDLGREEFLRRTWEWQKKHGRIIVDQLKKLGCSLDWSRERFTLDESYAAAVQAVFVDLYNKGYIYRGKRMVNWDPAALTALSDEEVIPRPQKNALLYYVKYEVADEPGRFVEVATTRPETIMADMAVAVNPADPRYVDLVGKSVWRPFPRAAIPVIADDAVDLKFGTGALKITPAHDKLDFEIGQRHGLGVVDILHPDGKIDCPAVPELDRLDRFAARKKAAEMLAEAGLLTKEEAHENNVGYSERSEVPIEPRLSEQWFLRYPKTGEALAVVREGLDPLLPATLGKGLRAMAGEHPGLVREPPGVVGPPGPGVVRAGRRNPRAARLTRRRVGAGRGHARHLVQLVAVGVRDDGRRDAREILSHRRARHRAGHHFLLGGADDHRGAGIQTQRHR